MKEVDSITKTIMSISKIIIRHTKEITEIIVLAFFLALLIEANEEVHTEQKTVNQAQNTELPEQYRIIHTTLSDEEEEIRNEIFYGELEEVALIVQAEAGNQDELGKRYVADVIWNRVDTKEFPDAVRDVIYQMDPIQFATTVNGAMGMAGYTITDDVFQIALEEYYNRTNSEIVYFRTDRYHECGTPAFKHGAHYFSTK